MDELSSRLKDELDKTYSTGDISKYDMLCKNIKSQGMRIFRNSRGQHQIRFL